MAEPIRSGSEGRSGLEGNLSSRIKRNGPLRFANPRSLPTLSGCTGRKRSLLIPQPGFRQIDVALDAAQDFIVDHVLVAEFKDGPAFLQERFLRQTFVF